MKFRVNVRAPRPTSQARVKWLDFSRERLRSTLPNTAAVLHALDKAQNIRIETLRSTISV